MQQMLMLLMSQLGGGGGQGGSGQGGAYNGHNDMLLGSFGAPTSIMSPGFYNAGKLDFLNSVRNDFIKSGEDQTLARIGSTLGIDSSTSASLVQMFPQLRGMISTRSDMTGGAFAMAAMQNPYLATAVPGKSELAEDNFRTFEKDLYERVRSRIDTDLAVDEGRFTGIQDESDAGAVLMHATQTGQAMLPKSRVNTAGQIVDLKPEELAQEAEKILERFDGVMEAGRKVFGPNESAQNILTKMRRVGGDVRSQAQGDDLVLEMNKTIGMAAMTHANIGAVLNSQAQLQDQLGQAGIIGEMGRRVAQVSTRTAMGNKHTSDLQKDFFAEQGYSVLNHSFETYQQAQAQNTLRVLHSDDQMREAAKDFANSKGMSTSSESINAIVASYGEDLLHFLSNDDLTENVGEASMQVARKGAKQIFNKRKSGYLNLDEDSAKKVFDRLFINEATAKNSMKLFQEAQKTGNWSALEKASGVGSLNNDTKAFIATTSQEIASETFGTVAELGDLSEEQRIALAEGQAAGSDKRKVLDNFLEHANKRRRSRIVDNITKLGKDGKLGLESVSAGELEAEIEGFKAMNDEELALHNIFKKETTGDDDKVPSEYFRVTDTDKADNISVQDALTGNAGGGNMEANIRLFFEMLAERIPMLSGLFLDQAGNREVS